MKKKNYLALLTLCSFALLTACSQTEKTTEVADPVSSSVQSSVSNSSSTASTEASSAAAETEASSSVEKAPLDEAAREQYAAVIHERAAYDSYNVYTFTDVDGNGSQEMLVGFELEGGEVMVTALYYLKDGQPELFKESKEALSGGSASTLTIFKGGTLLYVEGLTDSDDWTATTYRLKADNSDVEEIKTTSFQMSNTRKMVETLDLAQVEELDTKTLTWSPFEEMESASAS